LELLVTLLLLYLVQCAAFLPRESVLFTHPLRHWRIRVGPGWRLLPPLPTATWLHTRRFPLRLRDGRLWAHSSPSRFGWRSPDAPAEPMHPGPRVALDVTGKLVRIQGRPFYRAASKRSAERMASLLRSLEGASQAEIRRRIEAKLASSLSLGSFRDEVERFTAATRTFGWLCNLYLCFLFVGVPLLILLAHEERGLQLAFAAIAILHPATLFALVRAHRKLHPEPRGELFEQLLSATLYPPLLLRAHSELRVDLLGDFHPAVAAAALLPQAERLRFLRAEVLRLESSAAVSTGTAGGPVDEIPELELRALLELLTECGETREGLMKPPRKDDELARAYCPMCAADYIRPDGPCADCGVELVTYPA
jgi:hypothetical protein